MAVEDVFNAHSDKYDSERRDLIPCFDDFYGISVDVINYDGKAPKVLDLGAGTGVLTSFLLKKYPDAEITLVDLAEDMLDKARMKFKDNPNIAYKNENYITNSYDEKFDIIMSALSIHHLSSKDKKEIYEKYVNLLNDGGVFVNADLILEEDDYVEDMFFQKTNDLVIKKVGSQILREAEKRREYDDEDSISYQLDCLKNAGCKTVGVPYKFYNYAVMWAQK